MRNSGSKGLIQCSRAIVSLTMRIGFCALWMTSLVITGCPGKNTIKSDPLLGDRPPIEKVPDNTSAKLTSSKDETKVPEIPAITTAVSTAALATTTPLQGGRPLAITDDNGNGNVQLAGNNKTANPGKTEWSGNTGSNDNSGPVQLRRPVPVVAKNDDKASTVPKIPSTPPVVEPRATVPNNGPQQSPMNSTPVAPTPGWGPKQIPVVKGQSTQPNPQPSQPSVAKKDEQRTALQQELKKRGITRFRDITLESGIRFIAVVADPARQGNYTVIEATEPTYELAVQSVLRRVDQMNLKKK